MPLNGEEVLQAKGRPSSDLQETVNKVRYMKKCLLQQLFLPGEVQECFVPSPPTSLRIDQVKGGDSKEKCQSVSESTYINPCKWSLLGQSDCGNLEPGSIARAATEKAELSHLGKKGWEELDSLWWKRQKLHLGQRVKRRVMLMACSHRFLPSANFPLRGGTDPPLGNKQVIIYVQTIWY